MQKQQQSYAQLVEEELLPAQKPIPPPHKNNFKVPLIILGILVGIVLLIVAVYIAEIILVVVAVLALIIIFVSAAGK